MGYEKDYDLRFGNFLYLLSLQSVRKVVSFFHRSVKNDRKADFLATDSQYHNLLIGILRDPQQLV